MYARACAPPSFGAGRSVRSGTPAAGASSARTPPAGAVRVSGSVSPVPPDVADPAVGSVFPVPPDLAGAAEVPGLPGRKVAGTVGVLRSWFGPSGVTAGSSCRDGWCGVRR